MEPLEALKYMGSQQLHSSDDYWPVDLSIKRTKTAEVAARGKTNRSKGS